MTNVAIICYYSSLCHEYICIRSIKWFFTFSICFLERLVRSGGSLKKIIIILIIINLSFEPLLIVDCNICDS